MTKPRSRTAGGPRPSTLSRGAPSPKPELEPFDEPPHNAVPLALAPFLTLRSTLDDNGILREDAEQLDHVCERLRRMVDAHTVEIDPNAGTFDIAFEAERTLFGVSLARATFRPFEVDEPHALRRLSDEQKIIVKSVVGRVWTAMLKELSWQIQLGAYRLLARERTPLARGYEEISPRVFWDYFYIEKWLPGTALCRETGERLFDIHLRPAAPAIAKSSANNRAKSACSNWLVRLRRLGPQRGPKAQYEEEAAKQFGVGPGQFADAWEHAAQTTANDPAQHEWGLPGARWNRGFRIDWSEYRAPI
jgi:hypothetical protein